MSWQPSDPLSVLLIDDNEDDAFLLKRILRKISKEIRFVHCAVEEEARHLITEDTFDIVFLDNQLTLKNSVEMLTILRNDGFQGPVVLFTTVIDDRISDQLKSLACEISLEKGDVSQESVMEAIRSALAKRSS